MAQSNSKLNAGQKNNRKFWLNRLKGEGGVIATVGGVTVAVRRTGHNAGVFAVSFASLDERKLRRKVGEHYALYRMYCGEPMPLPLASVDGHSWPYDDADYLQNVAQDLAYSLNAQTEDERSAS